MARAKKTTTAKAKAPAKPAAKPVAKVPDGAAQLVDALNADYAAVCKRVHELGVADPDGRKDQNDIAIHQNSLDEIKSMSMGVYSKLLRQGRSTPNYNMKMV